MLPLATSVSTTFFTTWIHSSALHFTNPTSQIPFSPFTFIKNPSTWEGWCSGSTTTCWHPSKPKWDGLPIPFPGITPTSHQQVLTQHISDLFPPCWVHLQVHKMFLLTCPVGTFWSYQFILWTLQLLVKKTENPWVESGGFFPGYSWMKWGKEWAMWHDWSHTSTGLMESIICLVVSTVNILKFRSTSSWTPLWPFPHNHIMYQSVAEQDGGKKAKLYW